MTCEMMSRSRNTSNELVAYYINYKIQVSELLLSFLLRLLNDNNSLF